VVRELYPQLTEDARTGIIRTAWHPVHVQQGTDDDENQGTPNPSAPRSGLQTSNQLRQEFFIRFDVHLVGGKPWRVRVRGEASSWKAGEIPTPLHGADVPHWLEGRVNSLEVAIHQRLKKYAVAMKYAPTDESADAPAAPVKLDTAKFGKLPPGAAQVVAEVESAARVHDVVRLRKVMADQFTYSTGDAPSAETAIVVWQADPSILAQMVVALDAGCALDPAGSQAVCPAASASDPAFAGYRATFRAAGGIWKLVSFATAD